MFRPLGIGEIFDRAITIYTRNFVVFTLMVLTLLAPFSIVQFFATPDQSTSLAQAIDQIQHPTKKPEKTPDPFAGYTPAKAITLVVAFIAVMLFAPFVNNAVAVGVAAVYFGQQPDVKSSFATVFRRWPSVIGVALFAVLVLVTAYVAGVIGVILAFAVGIMLFKASVVLGIIAMILASVLFLAIILAFMLFAVCYAFAMYSVTLEDVGGWEAIAGAFARIFNRGEVGKALLMALSYVAIEMAVLTVSSTVGIVMLLVVRSTALQLAVNAVLGSMLAAFVAILLAVYYYDVRTRREGLDLEADLQRLTA